MPILQGDIKLLKSERMTDNEDGGGRITGNVIEDGLSNEIFPDVSDLDRVYGRTSLRKVFAGVETDDTDLYFGNHNIIDQAPDDENVTVLMFATGSAVDQRATARDRVESYVVSGPLTPMRLYGDQYIGQRSILAYQRVGQAVPDIGDVLLLATESGPNAGDSQYVRVTGVSTEDQVFTDGQGDFVRQVVTIEISGELGSRFYGHEPMRTTGTQPDTRLRRTNIAGNAAYFGISRLAFAASLGDREVQVDRVFQPIVPATTAESPVVDVQIGGNTAVSVTSGGITHEIPQVAETDQIAITLNNRGFNYTRNLQPLPAPGTVVVEYRALGRWYTLRDENGDGELIGAGTGQVNYTTGSVIVTCQEMPDAASALLFFWGTPIHYQDRAGYQVPFPTPNLRFELNHGGIVPGSVTVRWMSDDVEVTATDDGQGNLSGAATGRMVYGWMDAVNGDRLGEVWVEFADGSWPDANSLVVVDYEHGAAQVATFNPSKDGSGFIQLQLPNAPVAPGSVALQFQVTRRDWEESGYSIDFGGDQTLEWKGKWYTPSSGGNHVYDERREDEETLSYRVYDDGNGGWEAFEGTIDYEAGLVTINPQLVHDVNRWDRSGNVGNDNPTAEWSERGVTDDFADGSAVIAHWLPQVVNSTADSVSRNPNPLTVDLLPLLQDSIVPGTLRFTFRGATYEDRSGALYRDVDPQTGAGIFSGTIDYAESQVVLEDWGPSGSNQVSITSLVTVFGRWTVYDVFFRTPGSPLQVGGLTLLATTADGDLLNGQGQLNGTLTGDSVEGEVDYETGVAFARFGELVEDSTLTAAEKEEPWYDPANVEGGMIWKPRRVLPSACRFNTVVLTSLPLDAELLGLDPVRLPADGRVPIFRPATVAVVHNTQQTPWPLGTQAGDSLDVGRTRLALVHIEDANGDKLPEADFSVDMDAGIFTIDPGADLTGVVEPLYAVHRVEDMVLISDVQIGGTLTLVGQLSHDYPADTSYVSGALIGGDLQARWANLFDQQTWTGEWSDSLIGDDTTASYNSTVYPIEVTNRGTITERWALIFTSSTAFSVVGESVGQIMTGITSEDLAPTNPNTGVPYFVLDAAGWGSGWAAGNVLRFNTIGANTPIWLARTVLQGEAQASEFQFKMQVRGNVNADPQ